MNSYSVGSNTPTNPVPEPLARAFSERLTITAPELCRLMPMDPHTLKRHCARGTIGYLQTGFGEAAPRRFTLEHVLRFLAEREKAAPCPSTSRRVGRTTSTTSGSGEEGFLALLARRRSERQKAETKGAR